MLLELVTMSFQLHLKFRMTLQAVDFRFRMNGMTNRTINFAQVGFVRIPVGEIFGSCCIYERF